MIIAEPCAYILGFPITQRFGTPEWQSPFGVHTGTDFAMSTGQLVPAVRAGRVANAWPHVLPQSDPNWPQGICCIIDCGDGTRWWYAHLSRLDVGLGQNVGYGEVLGLSGATGAATGPHLHLEKNVHVDNPGSITWPGNWKPVDPESDLEEAMTPEIQAAIDAAIAAYGQRLEVELAQREQAAIDKAVAKIIAKLSA